MAKMAQDHAANELDSTSSEVAELSSAAWLTSLFDQHADAIFNYCYRRLGNRSDAEDVLSAVFLEAWRHRKRVPVGRDLPWLYGVATNVIRNHQRGQRRLTRLVRRLAEDRTVRFDGPTDMSSGDPYVERLIEGVRRLRPAEQEIFVLCAWEGLSYDQAALALGIPVGTVRSRLSRARRRLTELTEDVRTLEDDNPHDLEE